MIVVIDRSGARLKEAHDTKNLHVEVGDGLNEAEIAAILEQAELGGLANGHAFLRPAGLRYLAGPVATAAWNGSFMATVEYARARGWVNADGDLQAHLEQREAGQPD